MWNSFKIDEEKLPVTNFQSYSPELSRVYALTSFYAAQTGKYTPILGFGIWVYFDLLKWNHTK